MISKYAGKSIVIFVVAFMVTSSLLVVINDDGGQGPVFDDAVAGTLEDYTSSRTGLPVDGDYFFLKFGDLNDDGYDDLVAGAGQYQGTKDAAGIWAYTWKVSSSSWEKNSTGLPTTGYFAGLALGDVDDDGDLDIVVGGEGWSGSSIKGCRVYVNNGTAAGKINWDEETGPETSWYYDQVTLADINADGDMDIVAATKGSGIRVWIGDSSFGWTAKNTGLPTSGEYTGVTVADMNKDGDLDILATDYTASGVEVRLYTGDGTGSWTSRASSFATGNSVSYGVATGDVDKDGDMDIVYSKGRGVVCLLGNSGGGTLTSFTWTAANTNLPTSGQHSQLALADMDNDGDLDIVTGYVDGGINVYLGNGGAGTGQSWTKGSVSLPTSSKYYGCAVGDFNKDGVKDIGGAMWEDGSSAGGIYAWEGSIALDYDPTAEAAWNGTTVNETTSWLGDSVKLNGTKSSDPQDAPTGDPDGDLLTYDWNFTVVPGTSAITDTSLSPGDDSAVPSFTPDKVGVYRLSLAVQDSAGNWSDEVFTKLEVRKVNEAPVANAGPDQVVVVNDVVYLNSSASTDSDGVIMAWQWNASTGNPSTITLTDATLPEAYFVAPDTVGEYFFELIVRDDNTTWSEVDIVMVNITLPDNVVPVAVAPNDFVSTVLEVAPINGSGSYDSDGQIVAWDWNCTSHPSIPMTGSDTMVVSFTPPLTGVYIFSLTVQDERGAWAIEDSVTVTVQAADVNVPPVAEIGGAAVRVAYVGDDVTLDGTPSHDDDGTIVEYLWNCTSHPAQSFTGQNTTTVEFRPGEPGDFIFTLEVKDNNGSWSVAADSVTIQVKLPSDNSPPVAQIDGPTEKVRPGDKDVALDGSRSSDRDGAIVVFNWRCISHPTLVFTGQNTSFIQFTVETTGDYTFNLEVQDNQDAWSVETAYWVLSVKVNVPPVAAITGPTAGLPGRNYTFSAETSSDEDGDVVAWKWNCTSHTEVNINGTESETMVFNTTVADTYVFALVVEDDEGAWSAVTDWTMEINPVDQYPMADAGTDRQIRIGISVELNGDASYDPEGEIVTWRWRCTSHPNVPGLVNDDQMVASFTPPDPGTFVFSLTVQDEVGQWSAPDNITITVLEQNSAPQITVVAPTGGSAVLEGELLVIRWDTYDANDDYLMYKVEIWKDDLMRLARRSDLPHGTNNVTFNDTNFNFPRGTDLVAIIYCWETNTEDRYETTVNTDTFQIDKESVNPNPNGGGETDGIDTNIIIIGVVVLMALVLVGIMIMRGSSDDDEAPWEGDGQPETKEATRGAFATRMPTAPAKVAPQTGPATVNQPAAKQAAATDPKGRMLDCPSCGAPLDHDTDFGAPYCWDCDKYF